MEEFRTTIFEKSKKKIVKRLLYNSTIFGVIILIWGLYLYEVPMFGLLNVIGLSVILLGIKVYDDNYMGVSAYGDRKARLIIGESYLEIRDVIIPFADLTDLVIYVNEYLGMPRAIIGVHHGGNNTISFNHKGRLVTINYVIKNKEDYERLTEMVEEIEVNPEFKKNLRKLD